MATQDLPRIAITLETLASRHASLRTWRARCQGQAGVTDFLLAVKNITEPGATVTGSIWPVKDSSPMALVAALLGPFAVDPTSLGVAVRAQDALPFGGEFVGRFLSVRRDAGVRTIPFTSTPQGDWWVASCTLTPGPGVHFTLGINERESAAVLLPSDNRSAIVISARILGLWLGGEARKTEPPN